MTGLVPVGKRGAEGRLDTRRELVVVTWNVHKGLDPALTSELIAMCRLEHVDVLALQEARPSLILPPGFVGHHAQSFRRIGKREPEGVMTVAHAEPIEALRMRSPHRELFFLTPKAALISRYATLDGEPLTIVNVHGLNFDPRAQLLESQLGILADRVHAFEGPMIVAGDFNTWNDSRMRAVHDLAHRLGLEELEATLPGGRRGRFGGGRFERALKLDRRLHLDRMYVRGFAPTRVEWMERCRASDHVPLLAKLAWQAA